ncbi:MAG: GlsB/YeaQ/YmgE family stress response membrane protein [Saprospiraceae bacterium]|nr:GlsB/YeaQ/YmgE family stress response membrane protein [Saprospiraceae bacterium]MBP7679410.1 GlsB/YeaQ/YmgE family stress response membrane protein [Saprospiraceae bacterium]
MNWELITLIAIGAVAGYIGGRLVYGEGFSFLENVVVGVIGSFIGGRLFDFLNIQIGYGLLGKFITAVVGSLIALWLLGYIRSSSRATRRRR